VKKLLALGIAGALLASVTVADSGATPHRAEAILEQGRAQRPTKDFSLKGRLLLARDRTIPLEILVQNTATDTRTIYRSATTALLVIQPVRGEPTFFLRGTGQLTAEQRREKFLDGNFSYDDLGWGFLQWPAPVYVGADRQRGRNCHLLEARSDTEPYRRVRLWIDQEYHGLLRAEAFNEADVLVRRWAVTSFRKVGEIWIPRAIEISSLPPGQSLPAQDKSRLEIDGGSYDAQLPAEWFAPEHF